MKGIKLGLKKLGLTCAIISMLPGMMWGATSIEITDSMKPYNNQEMYFGKRDVTGTITIANTGTEDLNFDAIFLENEMMGFSSFFIEEGISSCFDESNVPSGESCEIVVHYTMEEEMMDISLPDRVVIVSNTEEGLNYVKLYKGDKTIKIDSTSRLHSRSIVGKRPRPVIVNIKNRGKKSKKIEWIGSLSDEFLDGGMFSVETEGGTLDKAYIHECGSLPRMLRPNESCAVSVIMYPNGDPGFLGFWGYDPEEDAAFFRDLIGVYTTNVKGRNGTLNMENIWGKISDESNEFWIGNEWPKVPLMGGG